MDKQDGQNEIKSCLSSSSMPGSYQHMLEEVLRGERLQRMQTSWGTTLIPRAGNGKRAWLVANWDGKGGKAVLPAGGHDVISGRKVPAGRLTVKPFECLAILSCLS